MNMYAKLRALVALCLVALVGVAGCKPSKQAVSAAAIDAALEVAKSEKPDTRFHVLTQMFSATGDNPAGWKIDPTTGNLVAPSGKVLEGLSYKNSVAATAIVNQPTLTGLAQTIDTIALSAAGMRVNLWNQTTTSEKGCWVTASGTWTRCPDFAAGSSAFGSYFPSGGSANKGVYLVTAPAAGSDVVGTANLTAVNLSSGGGGAVSSVNGQTGAVVIPVGTSIEVQAATTATLPTYTSSGGPGVGFTLTATANGALAAVDNVTLGTGDEFLLQNPTTLSDGGVYVLTQGTGGTPWSAIRDTRLDQAAEFAAGPRITVAPRGLVHGGGYYTYRIRDTITMGTTTLLARRVDMNRARATEGFSYVDDLSLPILPTVNTNMAPNGLDIQSATISTIQQNTNGSGVVGSLRLIVGATATFFGGIVESGSATMANGRSYPLDANVTVEFETRFFDEALSTGAAEFANNIGYASTSAASQVYPTNGMLFVYDRPGSAGQSASVNWKGCCVAASVITCSDTGIAVGTTAKTFTVSHEAGQANAYFDIDHVQVASVAWTACPAGTVVGAMNNLYSSVGASSKTFDVDTFANYYHNPQGRFP